MEAGVADSHGGHCSLETACPHLDEFGSRGEPGFPVGANFRSESPVSISPEHGEGTEGPSLDLLPATTENAEGPGGSKEGCLLMPPPPPAWPRL